MQRCFSSVRFALLFNIHLVFIIASYFEAKFLIEKSMWLVMTIRKKGEHKKEEKCFVAGWTNTGFLGKYKIDLLTKRIMPPITLSDWTYTSSDNLSLVWILFFFKKKMAVISRFSLFQYAVLN